MSFRILKSKYFLKNFIKKKIESFAFCDSIKKLIKVLLCIIIADSLLVNKYFLKLMFF